MSTTPAAATEKVWSRLKVLVQKVEERDFIFTPRQPRPASRVSRGQECSPSYVRLLNISSESLSEARQ
jgi:hypothetical protein